MNKENTEQLLKEFPELYQGYYGDIKHTLMPFGFECGDGWFEIIRDLSVQLEALGCVAIQVKEKFGTLRFYIESGSDAAFDLIDEAEVKTASTCEVCGEPGHQQEGGWIRTLCDACEAERHK